MGITIKKSIKKSASNPRFLVLFLDMITVKFHVDPHSSFLSNTGKFKYTSVCGMSTHTNLQ